MNYVNTTFKVLKPKKLVKFDPNNVEHVKTFQYFITKNNWKEGCPFELEQPYLDVPTMIRDKITKHYLISAV